MLIQLTFFLLAGIFAGTITGLSPGIHINLVGAILVSLSTSLLSPILPIYLIVFIVAMSITHTFVDFIPSIFLGAPDDADTGLSTLPGHELLKEGKGYEAVMLFIFGSLFGLFFFVFILTGLLGLGVLNLELKEPLLPLLTGLFGSSMLLLSIKQKTKIPYQKIDDDFKIPLKFPVIGSAIASPLCGFLPGLGGGQAAIIGNQISKSDKRGFIVLIGITNTLVMGISFLSLYTIQKARTGSAVSIQKILGNLSTEILILILFVSLLSV